MAYISTLPATNTPNNSYFSDTLNMKISPKQNGSSATAAHTSTKMTNIPNPFNDSMDQFDFSHKVNGNSSMQIKENAFSEMMALSMNVEKLDGVLNHINTTPSNPFVSNNNNQNHSNQETSSSFANNTNNNNLNELDLTKKRMDLSINAVNFPSSLVWDNIECESNKAFQLNNDQSNKNNSKTGAKKEIPIDLLKDVAKAAFNEFNNINYRNNEFYNKISAVDCVGNDFENGRIILK